MGVEKNNLLQYAVTEKKIKTEFENRFSRGLSFMSDYMPKPHKWWAKKKKEKWPLFHTKNITSQQNQCSHCVSERHQVQKHMHQFKLGHQDDVFALLLVLHRWRQAPVRCVKQRFLATVVGERNSQDAHLFDLPGPSVISGLCNHDNGDMGWIHVVLLNGLGL